MEQSDKKRFKELVQMLGANFRAEVTTPLLQAYWLGLQDISLARLEAAATKAIRKDEFLPSVARMRELAGKGSDVRPYHLPYAGLSKAERAQIEGTWREAERIPGGAPPVHVGELIGHFMAGAAKDDET